MKTNLNKILFILPAILLFFNACKSDDMNFKDAKVTAVQSLYEPTNGKSVNLSSSGSLFFSWAPALAEDGAAPLYELYFDKSDGDFSNPVYILTSDLNGYSNGAAVTHKILNKIAALLGAKPGETVTLKWTVNSTRGVNQVLSKETANLSVTRMYGFEDPGKLYITGAGTEAGTELSGALPMHRTEEGVYEIYTKLVSGGKYTFVDENHGTPVVYSVENNKLVEGDNNTINKLDGVYRVKVDLGTAAALDPVEITNVGFWFCPNNKVEWNLAYQGKGIWKGTGAVNFKVEGWGLDERYKFRVTTKSLNGDSSNEDWGPSNANEDGKPSGVASYFNLAVYSTADQWSHKWKFANDFNGQSTTMTITMAGATYSHTVAK